MSFEIRTQDNEVMLQLRGEVTVEQARALHTDLTERLTSKHSLAIDTTSLIRCDAAILQLLCAAHHAVGKTRILAASPAWNATLKRYGLEDYWPSANS